MFFTTTAKPFIRVRVTVTTPDTRAQTRLDAYTQYRGNNPASPSPSPSPSSPPSGSSPWLLGPGQVDRAMFPSSVFIEPSPDAISHQLKHAMTQLVAAASHVPDVNRFFVHVLESEQQQKQKQQHENHMQNRHNRRQQPPQQERPPWQYNSTARTSPSPPKSPLPAPSPSPSSSWLQTPPEMEAPRTTLSCRYNGDEVR